MDTALRRPLIAGNWKMNMTQQETAAFLPALLEALPEEEGEVEVVVFPPLLSLDAAGEALAGAWVSFGAQNCHFAKSGAYTGEVSAAMVQETGANFMLIGHSERRSYFGETDETVNKRLRAALDQGLSVVLCVGETLTEREAGATEGVLRSQTEKALEEVSAAEMEQVIIAYEPVWAIGTGVTASDSEAGDGCAYLRSVLVDLYGLEIANATRILYGGSMNDRNAEGLLAQGDIDGGLIGGASLRADAFAAIVEAAEKQAKKGAGT